MSDQKQRDSQSTADSAGETGVQRRHSDVVASPAEEEPLSGPVARDSGEVEIEEEALDPRTLVSGEPAVVSSVPVESEDALVDTMRDPTEGAIGFGQTLPADEVKAIVAAEAKPASKSGTNKRSGAKRSSSRSGEPTSSKNMDDTLAPSNRSYDSLGYEATPSLPDEETLADPLLGMVVADRYRLLERIGRGGMGIVYRVEHTSIGKLLAMKLLTGELSMNKEVVRRFKQEALTVSRLSNPYTVQVFDYGVWNHLTYLVMELVDGDDLGRLLRLQGPMPFARLGRLMVQVCTSLAEAHEKGIVHRDIKPENVMVVADAHGGETAKVLDFGLAKLRENAELNEVTLQGAVIGTPYYMSPEQVMGEDVDGRTDVYSVGAVMFRALTGTQAFKAATPMGMFTKHLNEAPPSAMERTPQLNIPQGVSEAVQRCMAKDPDERFASIEELRDVLLIELDALGLGSSDRLKLDIPSSAGTKKKRKTRPKPKKPKSDLTKSHIATRAELESYERKLRRTRYGASALLAAIVLGGVAAAGYYAFVTTKRRFVGSEHEPNDGAADANPLPLGRAVTGHLGKRLESGEGDRDFYGFTVPDNGARQLQLTLTSLPNFPMCAILYRVDFPQPLAQYCVGYAGQDLVVPAVRVDPGAHLVAVVQDRNQREDGQVPFVLENVSDPYELTVELVELPNGQEQEPNDSPSSAHKLAAGERLEGTLAWWGDEDFVCVADGTKGAVRWIVSDSKRPAGTVLEVTPLEDGVPGPLVRLHPPNTKPIERPHFEADVNAPWSSPPLAAAQGACLKLRLTGDPWARDASRMRPDTATYSVELAKAK